MIEDNKFTNLMRPYLNYIDDGSFYRKPFKWLYAIIAIANILVPFFALYQAVSGDILKMLEGKYLYILIFIWLIILVAGVLSFQLWWSRKDDVDNSSEKNDQFIATPAFAHLFQTLGEWVGTWIGIVGFFISLVLTIAFGEEAELLAEATGLDFIGTTIVAALLMPVYGFLIIIVSRFFAEQFRALASIANNTAKGK